jgi:hypothetical protein
VAFQETAEAASTNIANERKFVRPMIGNGYTNEMGWRSSSSGDRTSPFYIQRDPKFNVSVASKRDDLLKTDHLLDDS